MTRRDTTARTIGKFEYSAVPDWASTYRVRDWYDGKLIGTVTRVQSRRVWLAIPPNEEVDGTRYGYQTRREAAYALARYADTGNRDWIAP